MYRYVPAAVVCNIMITLPACAPGCFPPSLPADFYLSLSSSLTTSISHSLFLSFPSYAYTRLPGGHPLSAAMLPGNMIIVIICTLLRSYPPDSSPLRNSPVILPTWLPPFSRSLFIPESLSLPFSPSPLSLSLQHPRIVVPSCVMLRSSLLCPLLVTRISPVTAAAVALSRHPATPFSRIPAFSACMSLSLSLSRRRWPTN